jgi:fatty acid desaturase
MTPSSPRAGAEARLVGWAALDGAVMLTCWALSALGPWWMFLVMAPVLGGRIHALGVLLHDACHLPGRSGWTWLLEAVGGWPVGTTLESMRAHHLRHHARTNAPEDTYLAPRRTVGDGRLFLLLLGIFPFWVVRAALGVASFAVPRLEVAYAALLVSGEDDAAARRDVERARRVEWPVVVTWAALGALPVMAPSLMARSWWLPLSWAALFNACRFLAEHSQAPREAGLMETTRDITSAWLTPFVFPHHVGLHRTHHRFPNAPWEALPRLRGEAA